MPIEMDIVVVEFGDVSNLDRIVSVQLESDGPVYQSEATNAAGVASIGLPTSPARIVMVKVDGIPAMAWEIQGNNIIVHTQQVGR